MSQRARVGDFALVGEWVLEGIDLPERQALLGPSSDDLMYACYPVDKQHVRSGDEMLHVHWVDIGLRCPRFSTSSCTYSRSAHSEQ